MLEAMGFSRFLLLFQFIIHASHLPYRRSGLCPRGERLRLLRRGDNERDLDFELGERDRRLFLASFRSADGDFPEIQ